MNRWGALVVLAAAQFLRVLDQSMMNVSISRFVSAHHIEVGGAEYGLERAELDAIVSEYSDAQLQALRTALLFAGFIALGAFAGTRRLPTETLA
jgi:hypothetical protein